MFSKILTRISSFFFKEIILSLGFNLKGFEKVLYYTDINEDYVSYLSNISFIALFFLIVFEFFLIYLMVNWGILFNLLSFVITIIVSFTFGFMVFLILYKYPFYLLNSKKRKIDDEFKKTIRHLAVLRDDNLTITDVLNVFKNLETNFFLSKEAKKIISLTDYNHNLRDTFKSVINESFSEIEKNFFRKLIDVIDKKENLDHVVLEFLNNLEQSRREISEQKKSRVNLLFLVSIFLFFIFLTILIILFVILSTSIYLKQALLFFSIIFSVIEFVLVIILYK
jgi:hypothetical protein